MRLPLRLLLSFAPLSLLAFASAAAAQDRAVPVASPAPSRDCESVCPEIVVIPAGTFVMGSPNKEIGRETDEGPTHTVTIARPFAVGRFEVTFDEWDACVAKGGCKSIGAEAVVASDGGWGRGRRPVINVSWHDAHDYVVWLSTTTGKPYRLLSEAEWEYVARAGGRAAYSGGDLLSPKSANFKESGINATLPVGSFAPNRFGAYDLDGNVWEWVEDCYTANYATASNDGAASLAGDCGRRMLRGGAWNTPARFLRSAARGRNKADFRDNDFGFRVARDLP